MESEREMGVGPRSNGGPDEAHEGGCPHGKKLLFPSDLEAKKEVPLGREKVSLKEEHRGSELELKGRRGFFPPCDLI